MVDLTAQMMQRPQMRKIACAGFGHVHRMIFGCVVRKRKKFDKMLEALLEAEVVGMGHGQDAPSGDTIVGGLEELLATH